MGTKTVIKLTSELPLPPIQKTTLEAQITFERGEQEMGNAGFRVGTVACMVCNSPHSVEALAQQGVLRANEIP